LEKPNGSRGASSELPPDASDSDEDEQDPDNRRNLRQLDKRVSRSDELSDSEDEDDRRNMDVEETHESPPPVKTESHIREEEDVVFNTNSPNDIEEKDNPSQGPNPT